MDGLIYDPNFISAQEYPLLERELLNLHPIWEERYHEAKVQRQLLRPVYWLGSWQFACLNYYHPPKGIEYRCLRAEPFPPTLVKLTQWIESKTRREIPTAMIPAKWRLNTCLVNYYGNKLLENGKWDDCARVGEHKDFEPGPVGSLSLGEKALFQFVTKPKHAIRAEVKKQMWLEDSSLQVFAGPYWKEKVFHRVQRVTRNQGFDFKIDLLDFKVRRINLTLRYVPEEHIYDWNQFPKTVQKMIFPYIEKLATFSDFFKRMPPP